MAWSSEGKTRACRGEVSRPNSEQVPSRTGNREWVCQFPIQCSDGLTVALDLTYFPVLLCVSQHPAESVQPSLQAQQGEKLHVFMSSGWISVSCTVMVQQGNKCIRQDYSRIPPLWDFCLFLMWGNKQLIGRLGADSVITRCCIFFSPKHCLN